MRSNPQSFAWATRLLSYIPCDDAVLPFALERLDARGRIVRLGPLIDRILIITRHDYPTTVARLVGEAAALTIF
jgi:molecular chaperone Hsp33